MTEPKRPSEYPEIVPGEHEKLIADARANRERFLTEYKAKFEASRDPEIIIELVKLTPDHLREQWILDEVIQWLYQFEKLDYVEKAFMQQTGRDRQTVEQCRQETRDFVVWAHIEHMAAKQRASRQRESINRACREVALTLDGSGLPEQPELTLRKIYYRYKNRNKQRILPYPYYGHDVIEHDGRACIPIREPDDLTREGIEILGDWIYQA